MILDECWSRVARKHGRCMCLCMRVCACVCVCVCVLYREHRLSADQTLHKKKLKLVEEGTQRRIVYFGRYMSPPPQEGVVSISSSERLLTSLSV